MRRLLAFAILASAAYFGYQWYTTHSIPKLSTNTSIQMPVKVVEQKAKSSGVLNVLGESTTRILDKTTELLNSATDGQAEPVINKAVSDLQSRVKSLPEEEYQKVKYEFCKDIIPSPAPDEEGEE